MRTNFELNCALTIILSSFVLLCCCGDLTQGPAKQVSQEPSRPSANNSLDNKVANTGQDKTPTFDDGSIASKLVIPGIGSDVAKLSMSRDELVARFGKPNEEYDYNSPCSYSEIHWSPPSNANGSVDGDGIFAFLKNGSVFEIRFGKGYYTAEGIKYGAMLTNLEDKIAAPLFELTLSASTATNDENLFFMIEKERGIAYEIGAAYKTKKRVINAIYVFHPNNEFLPWGCITGNQTLVPLSVRKT